MQRTISAMVGKGSVNHNSRKIKTENVDGTRTHLNIDYCMERYGVEWEHKGTHEKHLSVLDYKKQKRTREVEELGSKIEEKQAEFEAISERIKNYDEGVKELSDLESRLEKAPEYTLPEPQSLMSAKTYKHKIVAPFVRKLKALLKTVLARCFEGWDHYHRLNTTNKKLYRENERLTKTNEKLSADNEVLRAEKEGVTEKLKAENQMLWVQQMNNIRNRAMEIVNSELIYA